MDEMTSKETESLTKQILESIKIILTLRGVDAETIALIDQIQHTK